MSKCSVEGKKIQEKNKLHVLAMSISSQLNNSICDDKAKVESYSTK